MMVQVKLSLAPGGLAVLNDYLGADGEVRRPRGLPCPSVRSVGVCCVPWCVCVCARAGVCVSAWAARSKRGEKGGCSGMRRGMAGGFVPCKGERGDQGRGV